MRLRSTFTSVLLVIGIAIILLFILYIFGFFNAIFYSIAGFSNSQISQAMYSYIYSQYQQCVNQYGSNSSMCQALLNQSNFISQQYSSSQSIYNIFSNPLVWLVTFAIAVIVVYIVAASKIQIPKS